MQSADDLEARLNPEADQLLEETRIACALANKIDSLFPSIDDLAENDKVIVLEKFRGARHEKNRAPQDVSTISCLGSRIGPRHALLLYLIGYKSLSDIAYAHPISVSSIPGIGGKRLKAIASTIFDHNFGTPEWRQELSKEEVNGQMSLDFSHCIKTENCRP